MSLLLLTQERRASIQLATSEIFSQKIETFLPPQQAGLSINEIDPPAGEVSTGLPTRLKIPSIYSNSNIEHVGITVNGEMDTPKKNENVAWYELGPRPGETGSAVITAHYGWRDGKVSAFDDLHNVSIGDIVYVDDDTGVSIAFIVREIRNYDWNADATNVFTSYDNKSHLNLITCAGDWNKEKMSYSKRLVVFTDKIE